MGISPSILKKLVLHPAYRTIFDETAKMAKAHQSDSQHIVEKYNASINNINGELNNILYSRLTKKVEKMNRENENSGKTIEELISGLELPSSLRSYLGEESDKKGSGIQLAQFLDGLSFPFLCICIAPIRPLYKR